MNVNSNPFDRVVLTVPGKLEYLDLIRMVVTDLVKRMGFDEEDTAKIEMAVDEACANAIEHGYGRSAPALGPPPKIDLAISIETNRIVITIIDAARPFSPEEFETPDQATYLAKGVGRGLGIYIMKTFMDELQHSPAPEGGNRLTLVKYLPSAAPASA